MRPQPADYHKQVSGEPGWAGVPREERNQRKYESDDNNNSAGSVRCAVIARLIGWEVAG